MLARAATIVSNVRTSFAPIPCQGPPSRAGSTEQFDSSEWAASPPPILMLHLPDKVFDSEVAPPVYTELAQKVRVTLCSAVANAQQPLPFATVVLAPSLRHTRAWLRTSPFPGARHNFMMDIPARYVPLAHAAADYGTTPDYFEYFDPQPRPPSELLQPAAMLSIIFCNLFSSWSSIIFK